MTQTRPKNDFQPDQYAFEAMIGVKKRQLISLIHDSGMFDTDTIAAFDQSRKTDGTYIIQAGDPPLISNAKSVINILQSLETVLPSVLSPLVEYLKSQSSAQSAWTLVKLIAGGAWNRNSLYLAYNSIHTLPFYLQQLQSALSVLPGIDGTFLPLVAELNNAIGREIQPALEQIKLLQEGAGEETWVTEETVDAVALSFSTVSPKEQIAGTLTVSGKENPFKSVLPSLEGIKVKIHASLNTMSEKSPAADTGLYSIMDEQNPTARNLMSALNAITLFTNALNDLHKASQFRKINVMDIFKSLGAAILEMEKIDLDSLKQIGAQTLTTILVEVLQKVEPILVQSVRWLEQAEIQLGLQTRFLQNQIQGVCEQFEKIAVTLDVKPAFQYPYWEQRLPVREEALRQKEQQLNDWRKAEQVLASIRVKPDSSLRDIIHLRNAALKLASPQTLYLAKSLSAVIDAKTGMDMLKTDITAMEKRVLEADDNTRAALIKELRALYQIQDKINENLLMIIHDPGASDAFSYRRGSKQLAAEQLPLPSKLLPKTQVYEQASKTARELITAAESDVKRLTHLVSEAQEHIITARLRKSGKENEPPVSRQLAELHHQLQSLSPMALYNLPIPGLQKLADALSDTSLPEVMALQKILLTACQEREAAERAPFHLVDNTNQMQLLNEAKQMLINNQLAEFNNIKSSIALVLGISVDEIDSKMKEQESSYIYYYSGRRFFEYPVVNIINEKLKALEIEKQQLMKTSEYQASGLENWVTARQNALAGLRESRFHLIAPDIAPHTAPLPESTETMTSPLRTPESDEALLVRLQNEKLGKIRSTLAMASQRVASLVQMEYLDPDQAVAFNKSLQKDGTYAISLSDSSLHKTIKSLLNCIARFDQFYLLVTEQFDSSSYLTTGNNIRRNKDSIKMKFQELLTEFGDLSFYLEEIRTLTTALAGSESQAILKQAGEIAAPILNSMAGWMNMPGFSEVLNVELSDVLSVDFNSASERMQETAASLKNAATPHPAQEIIPVEPAETEHLQLINAALNALRKYREEQESKSTRDISPETLANLKQFEKSLSSIRDSMLSMIQISQSDNPLLMLPIITKLIHSFNAMQKIDTSALSIVMNSLRDAVSSLQPLFSQLAVNVELLESRLGLKPDQMSNPVAQLCKMYDSFSAQLEITDQEDYPYLLAKIEAYSKLLEKESSEIEELVRFIHALQNKSLLRQLSFADLVRLRTILHQLPPSRAQAFLTPLNKIIAQVTGLSMLENKINQAKSQLSEAEKRINAAQDKLLRTRHEHSALENTMRFLASIQNSLTDGKPLSMTEITRLHGLYAKIYSVSLSSFCGQLAVKPDAILSFINKELPDMERQIRLKSEIIQREESNIEFQIKSYNLTRSELNAHESLVIELKRKNDALGSGDAQIQAYGYDPSSNSIRPITVTLDIQPILTVDTSQLVSDLAHARDILSDRHSLHAKKQERMFIENEDRIHNFMFNVDNILDGVENRYKLKHNALRTILFSDTLDEPFSISSIKDQTQRVRRMNSAQGLMEEFVARHPDTRMRTKYQLAMQSTNNPQAQLKAAAKTASNNTSLLGRMFRKAIGYPSHDDYIYYVSRYLSKDVNYQKVYGQLKHTPLEHSSSGIIMSSLPGQPTPERIELFSHSPETQSESASPPASTLPDSGKPGLSPSSTVSGQNPDAEDKSDSSRPIPH